MGGSGGIRTARLAVEGISKRFPGVVALSNVGLEIQPGEVHAVVGENGAGKSTLIMILSGVERADSGKIVLDGQQADIRTPAQAHRLGIGRGLRS